MTALSQSLIAEKIRLESQWNTQYLSQGKETIDMKSIEAKLERVKTKLKWKDLNPYESPLFIPE
jgi:hypothetical protein|tara:strand:- start:240 stop:431 length:192 start_codon:yes stop_codon:yes gene_type:complete